MESLILIVHVLLALAIVGLILLQQGKGADAGASFGSGASQTVFGSSGSGNFLTKATAILATLFFITSFALAVYAKQKATAEADLNIISTPALIEQQSSTVEEAALETDAALPTLDDTAPIDSTDLPKID